MLTQRRVLHGHGQEREILGNDDGEAEEKELGASEFV